MSISSSAARDDQDDSESQDSELALYVGGDVKLDRKYDPVNEGGVGGCCAGCNSWCVSVTRVFLFFIGGPILVTLALTWSSLGLVQLGNLYPNNNRMPNLEVTCVPAMDNCHDRTKLVNTLMHDQHVNDGARLVRTSNASWCCREMARCDARTAGSVALTASYATVVLFVFTAWVTTSVCSKPPSMFASSRKSTGRTRRGHGLLGGGRRDRGSSAGQSRADAALSHSRHLAAVSGEESPSSSSRAAPSAGTDPEVLGGNSMGSIVDAHGNSPGSTRTTRGFPVNKALASVSGEDRSRPSKGKDDRPCLAYCCTCTMRCLGVLFCCACECAWCTQGRRGKGKGKGKGKGRKPNRAKADATAVSGAPTDAGYSSPVQNDLSVDDSTAAESTGVDTDGGVSEGSVAAPAQDALHGTPQAGCCASCRAEVTGCPCTRSGPARAVQLNVIALAAGALAAVAEYMFMMEVNPQSTWDVTMMQQAATLGLPFGFAVWRKCRREGSAGGRQGLTSGGTVGLVFDTIALGSLTVMVLFASQFQAAFQGANFHWLVGVALVLYADVMYFGGGHVRRSQDRYTLWLGFTRIVTKIGTLAGLSLFAGGWLVSSGEVSPPNAFASLHTSCQLLTAPEAISIFTQGVYHNQYTSLIASYLGATATAGVLVHLMLQVRLQVMGLALPVGLTVLLVPFVCFSCALQDDQGPADDHVWCPQNWNWNWPLTDWRVTIGERYFRWGWHPVDEFNHGASEGVIIFCVVTAIVAQLVYARRLFHYLNHARLPLQELWYVPSFSITFLTQSLIVNRRRRKSKKKPRADAPGKRRASHAKDTNANPSPIPTAAHTRTNGESAVGSAARRGQALQRPRSPEAGPGAKKGDEDPPGGGLNSESEAPETPTDPLRVVFAVCMWRESEDEIAMYVQSLRDVFDSVTSVAEREVLTTPQQNKIIHKYEAHIVFDQAFEDDPWAGLTHHAAATPRAAPEPANPHLMVVENVMFLFRQLAQQLPKLVDPDHDPNVPTLLSNGNMEEVAKTFTKMRRTQRTEYGAVINLEHERFKVWIHLKDCFKVAAKSAGRYTGTEAADEDEEFEDDSDVDSGGAAAAAGAGTDGAEPPRPKSRIAVRIPLDSATSTATKLADMDFHRVPTDSSSTGTPSAVHTHDVAVCVLWTPKPEDSSSGPRPATRLLVHKRLHQPEGDDPESAVGDAVGVAVPTGRVRVGQSPEEAAAQTLERYTGMAFKPDDLEGLHAHSAYVTDKCPCGAPARTVFVRRFTSTNPPPVPGPKRPSTVATGQLAPAQAKVVGRGAGKHSCHFWATAEELRDMHHAKASHLMLPRVKSGHVKLRNMRIDVDLWQVLSAEKPLHMRVADEAQLAPYHRAACKGGKRWSMVYYINYIIGLNANKDDPVALDDMYVMMTDCDTRFRFADVQLLVDALHRDSKLAGVCGRVCPVKQANWVVQLQMFEYAAAHWLQKCAETMLGSVLCCPGCFSMYRLKQLNGIAHRYAGVAKSAKDFLRRDQGEDRWMCTLLLKSGYRMDYCAAAVCYTNTPDTFEKLFKQRRRWVTSTMQNLFDLATDNSIQQELPWLFVGYIMLSVFVSLLAPAMVTLLLCTGIIMWWDITPPLAFLLALVPPVLQIGWWWLTTQAIKRNDRATRYPSMKLHSSVWTYMRDVVCCSCWWSRGGGAAAALGGQAHDGGSAHSEVPSEFENESVPSATEHQALLANVARQPEVRSKTANRYKQRLLDSEMTMCKVVSAVYLLFVAAMAFGISRNVTDGGWDESIQRPSTWYFAAMVGSFACAYLLHPQDLALVPAGLMFFGGFPMTYMVLFLYSVLHVDTTDWGTRGGGGGNTPDRNRWKHRVTVPLAPRAQPSGEGGRGEASDVTAYETTEMERHRREAKRLKVKRTRYMEIVKHVVKSDSAGRPRTGADGIVDKTVSMTDMADKLVELRSSWILMIVVVNVVLLCVIGAAATIRTGKLGTNVASLVVLAACSVLIAVQFVCMLLHRAITFVSLVAIADQWERNFKSQQLDCCRRARRNMRRCRFNAGKSLRDMFKSPPKAGQSTTAGAADAVTGGGASGPGGASEAKASADGHSGALVSGTV